MKKFAAMILATVMTIGLVGCGEAVAAPSNHEESVWQEQLMQQANDEIGMPNITEFYEKKLAKEIFELRDDSNLICYAYTRSEMSGKYTFLGRCMGYGLPYSTQYTNPVKPVDDPNARLENRHSVIIEQADPNGLYSPEGLSATWLWMIDEDSGEPNIMYAEPEIVVTQKKLPERICEDWSLPDNY